MRVMTTPEAGAIGPVGPMPLTKTQLVVLAERAAGWSTSDVALCGWKSPALRSRSCWTRCGVSSGPPTRRMRLRKPSVPGIWPDPSSGSGIERGNGAAGRGANGCSPLCIFPSWQCPTLIPALLTINNRNRSKRYA